MNRKARVCRGIAGVLAVILLAGVGFWMRPLSYLDGLNHLMALFARSKSHTINVDGHRIHYLTEGPRTGAPVVLVHGLGGSCEDWRKLAPYFAKAGYRVYLPDLLGFGESDKPADFSYSIPDQSEALAGFLEELGLKQVELGGLSMGGGIVQYVAFRHPELVQRLMLFDAVGIREMPKWDTRLFTPSTPEDLAQLNALLMPNPPKVPGFVARDILRVTQERKWVIQQALKTMLTGRAATDGILPELKMPVLIVWGAEDHILPLSQGEAMHKLVPQSELDVFPGCGHLAVVQCADQVGPKTVAFVER